MNSKIHYLTLGLNQKIKTMKNFISLVAIILLIGWAIGYFGFGEAVGNFIHILLVLAIITLLYRLITGNKK